VERIKGAHTAIEIARKAGRNLILAGNRVTSEDGAQYWNEMIAPFINGKDVEYVGPVTDSEKNSLLGEAAAFVVPIEWDEPFGIVFAEALACGTPVISCARGALPEIVEHGRHGFLINSIDDGVHAIRRISEISRIECRARVEKKFSADVVVTQYEELYEKLLQQR